MLFQYYIQFYMQTDKSFSLNEQGVGKEQFYFGCKYGQEKHTVNRLTDDI